MKAILSKELRMVFSSMSGAFFAFSFLTISGLLLWLFSGRYNVVESGYADLTNFFSLAAILLAFLVPALTMRQFSEERRSKTLDVLYSRPVRISVIYLSKFLACYLFVLVTLFTTLIYVYTIYQLTIPIGNVDLSVIAASYASLMLLVAVFVAVGLFASSLTNNQIAALITGLILCFALYFGFELSAGLFESGKLANYLVSSSLHRNYELMQKGAWQIDSLLKLIAYFLLFSFLAIASLTRKNRTVVWAFSIFTAVLIMSQFTSPYRFDLTADRRHSLNDYSKDLLQSIGQENGEVEVEIFLTGNLNPDFQQLQDALGNMMQDFSSLSRGKFKFKYVDPFSLYSDEKELSREMGKQDMFGISLNEVDRKGKTSRQLIFPYAKVCYNERSQIISLLKYIQGYTAQENLNASIENLEFEFIDALRLLHQKEPKHIAFVEGHGELEGDALYDAETILSKYYFVSRGQIGNQVGILNRFEVVIVAGPISKFSEQEKYVLDQYLMNGGKVLWLVDGVRFSHSELEQNGTSPTIKNEVNLDDMLFTYGIRINPDLILDAQSASLFMMSGKEVATSSLQPCYYIPFLLPMNENLITKSIRDVRTSFASSIDFVGKNEEVKKNVLLTTSLRTRLNKVPEKITFETEDMQNNPNFFNQSFISAAVSLEGNFSSLYLNRNLPDSLNVDGHLKKDHSINTKMVVVSSSSLIKNDVDGTGQMPSYLPMGYDHVTDRMYGNRDFILNCVKWLDSDNGWMEMRSKEHKMYLLDKKKSYENRDLYALLNISLPIFVILIIVFLTFRYRKLKFTK